MQLHFALEPGSLVAHGMQRLNECVHVGRSLAYLIKLHALADVRKAHLNEMLGITGAGREHAPMCQ
ncbi:hypothetical protein D9M71_805510 [compost metagenome]